MCIFFYALSMNMKNHLKRNVLIYYMLKWHKTIEYMYIYIGKSIINSFGILFLFDKFVTQDL